MEESSKTKKKQSISRFSKWYVASHSAVFALTSLMLLLMEIKCFNMLAGDKLNEFFVTPTSLNVTIGVYFLFLALLPLIFCK